MKANSDTLWVKKTKQVVLLAFWLSAVTYPKVFAASDLDAVYSTLTNLEKTTFGKTFTADLVTTRVERLENKLFGKKQAGSLKTRIDGITLIAPEQPVDTKSQLKVPTVKELPNLATPIKPKPEAPKPTRMRDPLQDFAPPPMMPVVLQRPHEDANYQREVLEKYQEQMKTKILDLWHPTVNEAAVYTFSVDQNGHVSNLQNIVDSWTSGDKPLPTPSLAALESAIKLARLGPLPVGNDLHMQGSFSAYSGQKIVIWSKPQTVDTQEKGPKVAPSAVYVTDLERRIKRAWFPPRYETDQNIIVEFTVHKDGQMTDLNIIKADGTSASKLAASKAIENAAPFRAMDPNVIDKTKFTVVFKKSISEFTVNVVALAGLPGLSDSRNSITPATQEFPPQTSRSTTTLDTNEQRELQKKYLEKLKQEILHGWMAPVDGCVADCSFSLSVDGHISGLIYNDKPKGSVDTLAVALSNVSCGTTPFKDVVQLRAQLNSKWGTQSLVWLDLSAPKISTTKIISRSIDTQQLRELDRSEWSSVTIEGNDEEVIGGYPIGHLATKSGGEQLKKLLETKWQLPNPQSVKLTCQIGFTLSDSGKLQLLTVHQSSGSEEFDKSCREAVEAIGTVDRSLFSQKDSRLQACFSVEDIESTEVQIYIHKRDANSNTFEKDKNMEERIQNRWKATKDCKEFLINLNEDVRQSIVPVWSSFAENLRKPGKALITFNNKGQVISAEIINSTGDSKLDQALVEKLKTIPPRYRGAGRAAPSEILVEYNLDPSAKTKFRQF